MLRQILGLELLQWTDWVCPSQVTDVEFGSPVVPLLIWSVAIGLKCQNGRTASHSKLQLRHSPDLVALCNSDQVEAVDHTGHFVLGQSFNLDCHVRLGSERTHTGKLSHLEGHH